MKCAEEIKEKLKPTSKDEIPVVDVVFMCDCTGSMKSYMEKAKDTAKQILSDMKAQYADSSVFFSFIAYRDHCDKDLIEFLDLTGDVEEITKFIEHLSATGGGDEAEAVADGLFYAVNKVTWREDSLRQIIHILDAPPHGREFGGGDHFPYGCPCKNNYKELLKSLAKTNTEYMVLNFTPLVQKMVTIFKAYHPKIESVPLDIKPAVSGPDKKCRRMVAPPASSLIGKPEMPAMPSVSKSLAKSKRIKAAPAPPAAAYMAPMAMDIKSQVTMQMSSQISQSLMSNVEKRYKKKG